jgi:diacylglycerol kinase (ATP)
MPSKNLKNILMNEMENKKSINSFSLQARVKSISYAFEGLFRFFREEHNARVHLAATICVIILSLCLNISRLEILVLILTIGLVWIAEIFNTSIERIMDHLSPGRSRTVKYIKDLAAAAVLVASFIAIVTGCIIFIPKFL